MNATRQLRRVTGWVGLCVLLSLTLGCNKMLAKMSIDRARDRVGEAEEHRADKYAPDLLQRTNEAINKAQAEINTQNYAEARSSAKDASTKGKELLDRTKQARARDLKEQAYFWIGVAQTNQGQQEDPTLYNKIQKANESGQKQIEKEKWEASIKTFAGVVENVDYLLKNLEKKARQGLIEIEGHREQLLAEGVLEHAPEYEKQISMKIAQIRDLIEAKYNYRSALNERDQAHQIFQEGLQKTKEVRGQKMLVEIENLLDVATNLESELYAPQSYRTVSKEFQNLLTQFYDKNYDTVLATAPPLHTKVDELIVETKREAARASLKEVEGAIIGLTEANARIYLPGRVEQLDTLFEEAADLFEQGVPEAYVESRVKSLQALDHQKKIVEDFDILARQEINRASEQLGAAEGVFSTMAEVFDRPIPGQWTGEEKNLETIKMTLKQELLAKLAGAQTALALAHQRRVHEDYRTAIETSKMVVVDADYIRRQTFRIVAHNAILELAMQMSRFEREGGRQYAGDELDRSQVMLEECKMLLASGDYREAVRRTADTKAQVEVLKQELGRVAVRQIDEAQAALTDASNNQAETYDADTYTQAMVALDQARTSLVDDGRQEAIKWAEQAVELASKSSREAVRQWVEELMSKTDVWLDKSHRAGADRYASDALQKALGLRANVQTLYDEGNYGAAVQVGRQAEQAASDAFYGKIIEAEQAIVIAKRFEGWQHEPVRLSRAMLSLKYAREMIEREEYNLAQLHAHNALTLAHNVTRDAKTKAFDARMAHLEDNVEQAQVNGAGYYQVQDLVDILKAMNALRDEFDPHNLENTSAKVEALEARLAGIVEMTPQVLNQLTASMRARLAGFDRRGAREIMPAKFDEASRKIKYAELDFKAQKYQPSFLNAKDAQGLLDGIEAHLGERDYDLALNSELDNFTGLLRDFGPILNMGLSVMHQMVYGPQGHPQAFSLLNASSPSDLRNGIIEIGSRVQDLEVPPAREGLHTEAIEMLTLAKRGASNFEKLLILDQFSPKETKEILQAAYSQVHEARTRQQDIQGRLIYTRPANHPRGADLAAAF